MKGDGFQVGVVATRLEEQDSVFREFAKWEFLLQDWGMECYFFSGESDRAEDRTYLVPEASYAHPLIQEVNDAVFGKLARSSQMTGTVQQLRYHLKQHLYQFILNFDLDLLLLENCLSLPRNIPLGLAISEVIAETQLPAIAHHHDFSWDRSQFERNSVEDYLEAAFPPALASLHHVTMNPYARQQLAWRRGNQSEIIPQVLDFSNPTTPAEGLADSLRGDLGIEPLDTLVLQPTCIAARKRIEMSVDLARRLGGGSVVVVTRLAEPGQSAYVDYLLDYAASLGVEMVLGAEYFDLTRGQREEGGTVYSMTDAYQQADLVSYPSDISGYGIAFLEAIFHRKPLVLNATEAEKAGIRQQGFRTIEFPGFITEKAVRSALEVLNDPNMAEEAVQHNFELGRRYYSMERLESSLDALLKQAVGR